MVRDGLNLHIRGHTVIQILSEILSWVMTDEKRQEKFDGLSLTIRRWTFCGQQGSYGTSGGYEFGALQEHYSNIFCAGYNALLYDDPDINCSAKYRKGSMVNFRN